MFNEGIKSINDTDRLLEKWLTANMDSVIGSIYDLMGSREGATNLERGSWYAAYKKHFNQLHVHLLKKLKSAQQISYETVITTYLNLIEELWVKEENSYSGSKLKDLAKINYLNYIIENLNLFTGLNAELGEDRKELGDQGIKGVLRLLNFTNKSSLIPEMLITLTDPDTGITQQFHARDIAKYRHLMLFALASLSSVFEVELGHSTLNKLIGYMVVFLIKYTERLNSANLFLEEVKKRLLTHLPNDGDFNVNQASIPDDIFIQLNRLNPGLQCIDAQTEGLLKEDSINRLIQILVDAWLKNSDSLQKIKEEFNNIEMEITPTRKAAINRMLSDFINKLINLSVVSIDDERIQSIILSKANRIKQSNTNQQITFFCFSEIVSDNLAYIIQIISQEPSIQNTVDIV